MKSIQVIDNAGNCSFPIFRAPDEEFTAIFPQPGQDIQFAEDLGEEALAALLSIWKCPILKSDANGIHRTLFYGFEEKRRYFPTTKRERDWNPSSLNQAQRRLYGGDTGGG